MYCKSELLSPSEIDLGYHASCFDSIKKNNPEFDLIDLLTSDAYKILSNLMISQNLSYDSHSRRSILLQNSEEHVKIRVFLKKSSRKEQKEITNYTIQYEQYKTSIQCISRLWMFHCENLENLDPNFSSLATFDSNIQKIVNFLIKTIPFSKIIIDESSITISSAVWGFWNVTLHFSPDKMIIVSAIFRTKFNVIFSIDYQHIGFPSKIIDYIPYRNYRNNLWIEDSITTTLFDYLLVIREIDKSLLLKAETIINSTNLHVFAIDYYSILFYDYKKINDPFSPTIFIIFDDNFVITELNIYYFSQEKTISLLSINWSNNKKLYIYIRDVKGVDPLFKIFQKFNRIDELYISLDFKIEDDPDDDFDDSNAFNYFRKTKFPNIGTISRFEFHKHYRERIKTCIED